MDTELYKKTEKFVIDAFTKIGKTRGIPHFQRTAYWIGQLKPDADEAMYVAAVAHDVERAFRPPDFSPAKDAPKGFRDDFYLKIHPRRGAEITAEFLEKEGVDGKFIERVKSLIEAHEVGGNEDQDFLKDADSVSFFETNGSHFAEKVAMEMGKDVVRDKLAWMFDRITSKSAKEICRGWYEDAIAKLDNIEST